MRGHRHLQTGCEGLHPHPGAVTAGRLDGDDVGVDDQPDPGVAGPSAAEQVTVVVMEATRRLLASVLLPPGSRFEVLLVNAHEVKNVPGRKSDVSDATWLADLGAHGLLRASFVPPEAIRQLRDLTRARTTSPRAGPGRSSGWRNCWKTRHQTVLGGHRHHRGVGPVDARGLPVGHAPAPRPARCRATRIRCLGVSRATIGTRLLAAINSRARTGHHRR